MKRLLLLPAVLLPALLLAAAAPAVSIQPGTWTTRVDIVDIDMPGAPPMLAKLFAKHPQVWSGCVTPEQASKGVPIGTTREGKCTVSRSSMVNGRFSAHRVCTRAGETSTTDVAGTYLADSFTATGSTVVEGKRPMTMKLNMTGKRTGACS